MLPSRLSHRASILAVWNDELQRVEFFKSIALPFGSVCAVMAFNRVTRALRIILSLLFMLVNTNFFDYLWDTVMGCPVSEDQFIEQMVKFGHRTTVKLGLPEVLQSMIKFYKETSLQERLQYRASSWVFACGSQRVWEWVEVIQRYLVLLFVSGMTPYGLALRVQEAYYSISFTCCN